jgi:hypothetical protein
MSNAIGRRGAVVLLEPAAAFSKGRYSILLRFHAIQVGPVFPALPFPQYPLK